MNIREISKPVTSKALNESLAKKFGQRINIDSFTLDQLQDARNRIRTQLSQVETNESFDAVYKSETYQKNKLFLDVLNAAIAERANISETVIKEGAEDQAELVMAAKDMVDRITSWMEDTAEMQSESMLELGDAIRDELGQEQSQGFIDQVKPALESLYQALEGTRQSLTNGVAMLTGEGMPEEPMGAEEPSMEEPTEEPMMEPEMEPTVDSEDEFAASEPAAGGTEPTGRARRESIERLIKQNQILEHQRLARNLGTILSSKKK